MSASALPLTSSPPKSTSWLAAASSVITSSLRAPGRIDGVCRGPGARGEGPLVAQGVQVVVDTTEEDEGPGSRVVGHRGERPRARRARRGDLGPGRARIGPGVPQGVRVHVESSEEHDRVRRRVERHRRVGARLGCLRDPGGTGRGPGVPERVHARVETPEEDQLIGRRVVDDVGVAPRRGERGRGLRTPGDCARVVGPLVPERVRRRVEAAVEDHLLGRRVVGHRGVGPCGRRSRRRDLCPVGAVELPGVPKSVDAGAAESAEQHHLVGGRVVGHGRVGAHRRLVAEGELLPGVEVEEPGVLLHAPALGDPAEEDRLPEGRVVGHRVVRTRRG